MCRVFLRSPGSTPYGAKLRSLRPALFPDIGVLPGPATGRHLQPRFPKEPRGHVLVMHEVFEVRVDEIFHRVFCALLLSASRGGTQSTPRPAAPGPPRAGHARDQTPSRLSILLCETERVSGTDSAAAAQPSPGSRSKITRAEFRRHPDRQEHEPALSELSDTQSEDTATSFSLRLTEDRDVNVSSRTV